MLLVRNNFKMWNLKLSKNNIQYVQLWNLPGLSQVYHKQKAEMSIFNFSALGWLKFWAIINNFFLLCSIISHLKLQSLWLFGGMWIEHSMFLNPCSKGTFLHRLNPCVDRPKAQTRKNRTEQLLRGLQTELPSFLVLTAQQLDLWSIGVRSGTQETGPSVLPLLVN